MDLGFTPNHEKPGGDLDEWHFGFLFGRAEFINVRMELSDVYLKLGEYGNSYSMLNAALEEPSLDRGDILLTGAALLTLAQRYLAAGQLEPALSPFKQCYQVLSKLSPTNELAVCCKLLKKVYLKLRQPNEAFFYDNEAKRIRKALTR